MFFRNLIFFRFPTAAGPAMPSSIGACIDEAIDTSLPDVALRPCGPLEMATVGFVSPYGRDSEVFTMRLGDTVGVAVGAEEKILPPAVVNDLLSKRIALAKEQGLEVGGRTRKNIRAELIDELLPRAFVQPRRTMAFFDFARGYICIDTSSRKLAEGIVSEVRHAVGSFPALPLNAEVAPRSILTGWIAGEALPEGMSLGSDCELREPGDKAHMVRIENGELQGEELQQHLEAGMQCVRLALTYNERLSFTIGEDLVVRKLKFLDNALEDLSSDKQEDQLAELDARYLLNVGEIRELFAVLEKAFKITPSEVQEDALAADTARAAVKKAIGDPKVRKAASQAAKKLQELADKHGTTMTISHGDRVIAEIKPTAGDIADEDPLYAQAVSIVRDMEKTSISHLQRVLKIGYNRAACLIESMENRGVVSPPNAAGTRTILSY